MEIKSILTGIQTYKQTEIENNKSSQARNQNTSDTGDKVTFSSKAKLFQEGLKVAKQSPDVRQEKINELKEKIKTGEYQVNEQTIAQKMLKEDIDIWL